MKDTVVINQISYTLETIWQDCWHRLINGAVSPKHAFHTPSIATIDGGMPQIRTVVLRKVIPQLNTLVFYTDYRSPKVIQLQSNNNISWLFYDAKSRIQLRIKSEAAIHYQDDFALVSWNETRLESRICYMVQPAPSVIAHTPTDGLPDEFNSKVLTHENLFRGYQNFAVIKNKVSEIDWLFLNHEGHRRARFMVEEHGINMHWLVP
jgi:pyridoxamine 5'-phosphate oxidase